MVHKYYNIERSQGKKTNKKKRFQERKKENKGKTKKLKFDENSKIFSKES